MGIFKFFQSAQLSHIYEKQLSGLGINPRKHPPQLHARICTVAQRHADEVCNTLRFTGQARTDHIWASMIAAADLLAICTMGPAIAKQRIGYDPARVIKDAADEWGPNGSETTLIISAIDELVGLHPDFKAALLEATEQARQERARQAPPQPEVGFEEQRVRNRARYEQMLAAKKVELALAAKVP
jgi:hypothetical protein